MHTHTHTYTHTHTHTHQSQGPESVCIPGGKQIIKLMVNEHSKIITGNTQTHIGWLIAIDSTEVINKEAGGVEIIYKWLIMKLFSYWRKEERGLKSLSFPTVATQRVCRALIKPGRSWRWKLQSEIIHGSLQEVIQLLFFEVLIKTRGTRWFARSWIPFFKGWLSLISLSVCF